MNSAFSASSGNPANTFATDTLNPTGSFTYSRPCAGGAPLYRDSTATSAAGTGTSIVVSTPTTAAGDYLIAAVLLAASPPPTATAPAGWTLVQSTTSGTFARLQVYARARPASPPANYTFTWPAASGYVYATMLSYFGAASVSVSASQSGATATATAPSLTPLAAPTALLTIYGSTSQTMNTPAGMAARETGNYLHAFDEARNSTAPTGIRSGSLGGVAAWVTTSLLLGASSGTADPTITLNWTVTPDTYATGYEIIRTVPAAGPATSVAGRNTLTWDDTTTTASTAYTYTITAVYARWRSTTRTVNVPTC